MKIQILFFFKGQNLLKLYLDFGLKDLLYLINLNNFFYNFTITIY